MFEILLPYYQSRRSRGCDSRRDLEDGNWVEASRALDLGLPSIPSVDTHQCYVQSSSIYIIMHSSTP